MRSLFVILLSLFFVLGYSQPPGYTPKKGYPYFVKDAKGKIIGADIAGAFSALAADTTSEYLVQPPDTAQVFDITMVNPGDVSTPPLAEGVQAYWSFEETAGATAFDSAASYDGTLINTPTKSETGISNLCFSYAAASEEWIDFGTSFWDVGTDDLSVCGWVNPSSLNSSRGVIGCYGTDKYWYLRLRQTGNVFAAVYNFGDGEAQIISNNAIPIDTWTFFYIELDRDGYISMHINNVLQTNTLDISAYSAVDMANSNTFAIGRVGNDKVDAYSPYYMNGLIDEISVRDRLLSPTEISNKYNQGVGKFWPYGVIGGDTLNMTIEDYDTRADTFRVNSKYIGDGYPTSRTDGDLEFAFGIADIVDYLDTNFLYTLLGDTTRLYALWSGLIPEDIWTETANYDSVFIDSSDKTPPIQDVGVWDTLWYEDFEQHTDAPLYYDLDLWHIDWGNPSAPGWPWRHSDVRWPGWWAGQLKDSIVIDLETSSKVIKFSFEDTCADGYCCWNPSRGGDYWVYALDDEYQEVYFSYNVKFRPGWMWSWGGKMPGLNGGNEFSSGGYRPDPGMGFDWGQMFAWTLVEAEGGMNDFVYYQGMVRDYLGDSYSWREFQPAGLDYNSEGRFIFDTDPERWYNITIRLVVNTIDGGIAYSDGLAEGFVDGKLVHQKTGLYLLDPSQDGLGINRIHIANFFGGNNPSLRDEWSYFDDFILFTYDESVDVPRGNEPSPPGRVLNLPNLKE